ncbi:MAG: L-seryl-tRNA(Sec) selenium transferase, partial [Dehalococcoidia bacterium]|nr:L-seryl-tRNA(Sec) selenium transferase [Dehalococcoidia bacterium]
RAQRWAAVVGSVATVEKGESMIGGGSLPGSVLPTQLLAIREQAKGREKKALPELAWRLRVGDPNVMCRIEKDRLLLDPRTVLAEEEEVLLTRLRSDIAEVFPSG